MEVNVKFEFDGYDLIAEGFVLSPGHVEGVELTFQGMYNKDVPENDYKIAKELARELLISKVYESELEF